MKKMRLSYFLFFTIFSHAVFAQNNDVMMQGFNWESCTNPNGWYNIVASKAATLKSVGINAIWMPPPSDANDGGNGVGYLPRKWYNLDAHYGSQAQLQSCINTLHQNHIKVLADIVINHRSGVNTSLDFQNPSWGCWSVANNDEQPGSHCGNGDTGEGLPYCADLDHTNITVQNDIKSWMGWLKNTIGFDGWRYDFVKGYSGYYTAMYNKATNPYISIGEYWDYDRQLVQNWVDAAQQTSTAFDFPTKNLLVQAVNGNYAALSNNGTAAGLLGWSPTKSVTFLDNHDTYRESSKFPNDNGKLLQGYAYILTHPGIPMIFWSHYFDEGTTQKTKIEELIKVRKDNAIVASSKLNIVAASNGLYAAIIDNKVAMKIGWTDWSPGTGWTLRTSGTNYAVWDKSVVNTVVADFTQSVTSGVTPLSVTFNAVTSTATAGIKSYTWNFGDGTTTTGVSVSKTYTTAGTYSPTLTVTDNNNLTSIKNGSVVVTTAPISDSIVVYFENTDNWANPKVYCWNALPTGSQTAAAWPGVNMNVTGCGKWLRYVWKSTTSVNLIFNDGGTNKTADLTRTTGTYNYSWATKTWNTGLPTNCSDSVVVYFDNKIANYSSPGIWYSPGAGANAAIAKMTKYCGNIYKFVFSNSSSQYVKFDNYDTYVYDRTFTGTIIQKGINTYDGQVWNTNTPSCTSTDSIVVYFENTGNWTTPKIYSWNALPAGSQTTMTWPGNNMTSINCGKWFKYVFKGSNGISLIFNDGGVNKTADLSQVKGIYNYSWTNKVWSSGVPAACGTPVTDSIVVYFENTANWTTPKIYYWNPSPLNNQNTLSWPGINMTATGCGKWFKYVFKGTSGINLIFNDGGTNKTIDLSRTTGIYNFSWTTQAWLTGKPSGCSTFARPENIITKNVYTLDAKAYPNPSVNGTTIFYSIPSADNVTITLYDSKGSIAAKLLNAYKQAGAYYLPITTNNLPGGIYYYIVKIGKRSVYQKLIIAR